MFPISFISPYNARRYIIQNNHVLLWIVYLVFTFNYVVQNCIAMVDKMIIHFFELFIITWILKCCESLTTFQRINTKEVWKYPLKIIVLWVMLSCSYLEIRRRWRQNIASSLHSNLMEVGQRITGWNLTEKSPMSKMSLQCVIGRNLGILRRPSM